MFFILVVLKISQYSQENTCVGSIVNKITGLKSWILIKKEARRQVLFCKYCESFQNSFFIKHLLFIILFQNFMWWQNSLGVFGYKIHIFDISCPIALFSFITLVLLVFIPKFSVSVTFVRIRTSTPALFWLNR